MMRSLFAGVSALRNHQIRMDVIANNIANVNTIGFKASRVTFQEMLSQKIRDASAPQGNRGGTNPIQVGLGSSLATINVNHTQGNSETTNVETDLMIEGAGYFVLGDGLERYYTRAGMLLIDRDGSLVLDGTGLKVLGWMADQNGNIDTTQALQELRIPASAVIPPQATTSITYAGNLDSTTTGELAVSPFTIQSATDTGQVTFRFTPTGNFNEFRWDITVTGGAVTPATAPTSGIVRVDDATGAITWLDNSANPVGTIAVSLGTGANPNVTITLPGAVNANGTVDFDWDNGAGDTGTQAGTFTDAPEKVTTISVYDSLGNLHDVVTRFIKTGDNVWDWVAEDNFGTQIGGGTLTFDSSGRLIGQTGNISFNPPGQAAAPLSIQPDFSGIYQVAEASTAQAIEQNGYPAGELADYSIDSRGVINGSFSNGLNRQLGQVALANFVNPPGLAKAGNNLYVVTPNSGQPLIGAAGTGDLGEIQSGRLEMSNVDLSQEFTNMIITQRGFQANSRIITTSDELLQELVNLKR